MTCDRRARFPKAGVAGPSAAGRHLPLTRSDSRGARGDLGPWDGRSRPARRPAPGRDRPVDSIPPAWEDGGCELPPSSPSPCQASAAACPTGWSTGSPAQAVREPRGRDVERLRRRRGHLERVGRLPPRQPRAARRRRCRGAGRRHRQQRPVGEGRGDGRARGLGGVRGRGGHALERARLPVEVHGRRVRGGDLRRDGPDAGLGARGAPRRRARRGFSHDGEHCPGGRAHGRGPRAPGPRGPRCQRGDLGLNSSTFAGRGAALGLARPRDRVPPAAGRRPRRLADPGVGQRRGLQRVGPVHLSGRTHVGDVDVAVRVDAMAGGGAYARRG